MTMGVRNRPEDAWARVERRTLDECWPWVGTIDGDGYGRIFIGGKNTLAHRVIYQLATGDPATGLLICHHCDNRPCCNPAHLFPGTPLDNMRDMIAKGRQRAGERSPVAKLTERDVLQIRELYGAGWDRRDLAEVYGVTPTNISSIGKRLTWRHLA